MTRKHYCYCKNWQFRNNSSNVAAVLNPEKRKSGHTYILGNNCYCREKKIPPRLFSNPKECVQDDSNRVQLPFNRKTLKSDDRQIEQSDLFNEIRSKEKHETDRETYRIVSNNSLDQNYKKFRTNSAKPELDYDIYKSKYPSTVFNSQKTNLSNSKSNKLVITYNNNKDLSRTSSFQSSQDAKYDNKFEHSTEYESDDQLTYLDQVNKYVSDYEDEGDEIYLDYGTTTKIKRYNTKPSLFRDDNPTEEIDESETQIDPSSKHQKQKPKKSKLQNLVDFRNDHYFETHSTEDLIKEVPEHICVHKFGLDNRLLLDPLNSDSYGVSRCIICDKVMENSNVNKTDKRLVDKKNNVLSKYYKYGLVPRKIYLGGDDKTMIELKLDRNDKDLDLKYLKKPKYYDNYALRYQKGVV